MRCDLPVYFGDSFEYAKVVRADHDVVGATAADVLQLHDVERLMLRLLLLLREAALDGVIGHQDRFS